MLVQAFGPEYALLHNSDSVPSYVFVIIRCRVNQDRVQWASPSRTLVTSTATLETFFHAVEKTVGAVVRVPTIRLVHTKYVASAQQ